MRLDRNWFYGRLPSAGAMMQICEFLAACYFIYLWWPSTQYNAKRVRVHRKTRFHSVEWMQAEEGKSVTSTKRRFAVQRTRKANGQHLVALVTEMCLEREWNWALCDCQLSRTTERHGAGMIIKCGARFMFRVFMKGIIRNSHSPVAQNHRNRYKFELAA